jgi:hypothetical protein
MSITESNELKNVINEDNGDTSQRTLLAEVQEKLREHSLDVKRTCPSEIAGVKGSDDLFWDEASRSMTLYIIHDIDDVKRIRAFLPDNEQTLLNLLRMFDECEIPTDKGVKELFRAYHEMRAYLETMRMYKEHFLNDEWCELVEVNPTCGNKYLSDWMPSEDDDDLYDRIQGIFREKDRPDNKGLTLYYLVRV